jgi:transposase
MTKVTKIDQKEQFIELRAKGVSYDEIAKEIGVSKPTLIKWGRIGNQ